MLLTMITLVFLNSITGLRAQKRSSIQNKSGVGTEYGMQIQALMGCRGAYGSCWNNTVPSTQLVDMYEFKDGRPSIGMRFSPVIML